MLKLWHTIKGYVAGAVAFISCPCHLPITLPLLISATAGTVFSAWLANNVILVGALSTVMFLGGLGLALNWTGQGKSLLPDATAGAPEVTLVTSRACRAACRSAKSVWLSADEQVGFKLVDVDLLSPRGRKLADRHNLLATPAAIVNDKLVVRGVPSLDRALEAIRPVGADAQYNPIVEEGEI